LSWLLADHILPCNYFFFFSCLFWVIEISQSFSNFKGSRFTIAFKTWELSVNILSVCFQLPFGKSDSIRSVSSLTALIAYHINFKGKWYKKDDMESDTIPLWRDLHKIRHYHVDFKGKWSKHKDHMHRPETIKQHTHRICIWFDVPLVKTVAK
jgi:uncharacterized membrane protein